MTSLVDVTATIRADHTAQIRHKDRLIKLAFASGLLLGFVAGMLFVARFHG